MDRIPDVYHPRVNDGRFTPVTRLRRASSDPGMETENGFNDLERLGVKGIDILPVIHMTGIPYNHS